MIMPFIYLVFFLLYGILSGFCWPYVINEWLEVAGKEPIIVFWQGALIGYVPILGQLGLPAVVATWIALMFL